jgi:hypothetical protein
MFVPYIQKRQKMINRNNYNHDNNKTHALCIGFNLDLI